MYNLNASHKGSALIVGLIIVVLVTVLATSFLEKVLNLGKTSGGIDRSAQSYSLATGLIEEQLMTGTMTKEAPWNISIKSEWTYTATWRNLTAYTGGTMIPDPWKWNSSFSWNWNIIGMGEPVQIVIPAGLWDWSSVNFRFRVPNIPGATNTGSAIGIAGSGIILWTFGYSWASLYASGETQIFKLGDITWWDEKIASFTGITNTWSIFRFDNFYADPTSGVWTNGTKCGSTYQCTLKLSMIRPFLTAWWQSFSFLEYQISFGSTRIPSQYMIIDSSAYVLGYLRSRQVRIPQITTNTATDFAVLQ